MCDIAVLKKFCLLLLFASHQGQFYRIYFKTAIQSPPSTTVFMTQHRYYTFGLIAKFLS